MQTNDIEMVINIILSQFLCHWVSDNENENNAENKQKTIQFLLMKDLEKELR